MPGLEEDPREVGPACPALGRDKAVMLGYHRVQNDSLVCLDLIVPNCSSQTDTKASGLEGRITGWIRASRRQFELCSLGASEANSKDR